MKAAVYCYSYGTMLSSAGRPCSQAITSFTCRRYFQFFTRETTRQCQNMPITSIVRNSQTGRSLSSAGKPLEPVVLYTHNNPKFLRMVNIFGYSMGSFWLFTSYQFFTMRIPSPSERSSQLPWFARFDLMTSTTSKVVAALLSSFIGCAVLGGAWIYSLRSVGKIILERGGKSITLTTFNPFTFTMNQRMTANLSEVSCQGHRLSNNVVPIKVKNRWMHYLVSNEGSYHNAPLFDRTVGLKRSI